MTTDHYCAFLQGNYVGMHASVLFQRWAFNGLQYDTNLGACEDYDIYLKMSRRFRVLHHTELIAVYRIHHTNMSGNTVLMADSALLVLKQQKKFLKNASEKKCYKQGIKHWKQYYGEQLYEKILTQLHENRLKRSDLNALKRYDKKLYHIVVKKRNSQLKTRLRQSLPPFVKNIYRRFKGSNK